jgi:predicted kinase
MKPKLIILNGPCGIGKNTIAEIYKKEHHNTLVADIDKTRRSIPNYREQREKSYEEACKLAFFEVEENLSKGRDVIVPSKIKRPEVLDTFGKIAQKNGADFYEFVLWTTKEDALKRAIERGFKPNSLLQEDRLEGMYDELEEMLKNRPNVLLINSKDGEIAKTYSEIVKFLG